MTTDTTTPDLLRPPIPHRLQVEVTGSCNLRCRMCIIRYRPTLPRSASMSLDQLLHLLDELPEVRELALQGIGEPLLAPDLYEMIAAASARGLFVEFNTNATLLTRRAGERLIAAGFGALHISLDGASRETYEFVRDGSRWDVVERNITGFVALLRQRRVVRPRLSLVMVLMERNLRELPDLVRLAAAWGIPEIFVQGLSHSFSDAPPDAYAAIAGYIADQSATRLPRGVVDEVYARAHAAAAETGVALRLPALDERQLPIAVDGVPVGCNWPWTGGYIRYNGEVLPCCMVMGEGRILLGNVHDTPYREIWHGEAFRRFREGLVSGEPHPVCRGCALYRGTF